MITRIRTKNSKRIIFIATSIVLIGILFSNIVNAHYAEEVYHPHHPYYLQHPAHIHYSPHHYHYVPTHVHLHHTPAHDVNFSYWTNWYKISSHCYRSCLVDRLGRTLKCTHECY